MRCVLKIVCVCQAVCSTLIKTSILNRMKALQPTIPLSHEIIISQTYVVKISVNLHEHHGLSLEPYM